SRSVHTGSAWSSRRGRPPRPCSHARLPRPPARARHRIPAGGGHHPCVARRPARWGRGCGGAASGLDYSVEFTMLYEAILPFCSTVFAWPRTTIGCNFPDGEHAMNSRSGAGRPAKRASSPVSGSRGRKDAGGRAAGSTVPAGEQVLDLAPVLAAVRRLVPAAGQAQAREFLAAFYQRLEADEYPQHAPAAWAAIGLDMLEFARRRKPGTANVRVFNPDRQANGWESPYTVLQIVNDDMPFLVDSVSMALADMGVGVHVLGHPLVRMQRDRGGRLLKVGQGQAESLMLIELDRQPSEAMAQIERWI